MFLFGDSVLSVLSERTEGATRTKAHKLRGESWLATRRVVGYMGKNNKYISVIIWFRKNSCF